MKILIVYHYGQIWLFRVAFFFLLLKGKSPKKLKVKHIYPVPPYTKKISKQRPVFLKLGFLIQKGVARGLQDYFTEDQGNATLASTLPSKLGGWIVAAAH